MRDHPAVTSVYAAANHDQITSANAALSYLGIDNDIIRDIVRNEVEKLLVALEKLEAANPHPMKE